MNDELLRDKYILLNNNLKNINHRLDDLIAACDELNMGFKEFMLIDDDVINAELFNFTSKEIYKIKSELVNELIPKINDKI